VLDIIIFCRRLVLLVDIEVADLALRFHQVIESLLEVQLNRIYHMMSFNNLGENLYLALLMNKRSDR